MQCYLINLDRAPERLKRMQELLDERGIRFERVAAIDGHLLSSDELERYRAQSPTGQIMSIGDIACGATHISILRKIANGENEFGVIMEDDLHLSDDIGDFINSTAWIPQDADVIKMETYFQRTFVDSHGLKTFNNRRLVRLRGRHWGTAFYVIRKSAAQRVLSEFTAGLTCIDQYIFGEALKYLKVYQIDPAPSIQDTTSGTTTSSFLSSSIMIAPSKSVKKKGLAKLKREFNRALRKIYSAAYIVWVFIAHGQIRKIIPYRK